MSALDELRFTKLDLKLSDFVAQYRDELPVILTVNSGIDPADDPLHCISAEEMYWIHGIHRQKRIIAVDIKKDKNRRYFSIPVDYDRKFQLVTREDYEQILSPPMYMKQIVEGMNLMHGPTRFVFANSDNIRINFEGSKSFCRQIGILEILEKYEQKYLVGHTLYKNMMDMRPCSIPIYLDVTVDVANCFHRRNDATFKEWMLRINELGRSNRKTTPKTCGAIIQYQELPECGVYDYIQPLNYLQTKDIEKSQDTETSGSAPRNIYSMRPSDASHRTTNDIDISTPPPIPERTWATKSLPPIPSHTSNPLPVSGKRQRPPAPPSKKEELVYDECRPTEPPNLNRRKDRLQEIGSYEIVPYAESPSVFQELLKARKDKLKATKTSATSQEDENPYSECTPEPFLSKGGFAIQKYSDDYEIAPYSQSRPVFPEDLPKTDIDTNSDYNSVTPYEFVNINDKSRSTYPKPFPRGQGKTTEAATSVTSEEVKVNLYPSECKPAPAEPLPGGKDVSGPSTAEIESNTYDECKPVSESRLSVASKALEFPHKDRTPVSLEHEDWTPTSLETTPATKNEEHGTNTYDEPIKHKSLNPLSDDTETKTTGDYEPVQLDSFEKYNNILEVPPDFNVSSLSVAEVAHCLSLLSLSKYAEAFRMNDVDGKLVSEFSKETLVACFNFSDFEAMKFTKFLEGWRPHVK